MSDVREVSEWHDAMEGTLTVAGERLNDALSDLWTTFRDDLSDSVIGDLLRWIGHRT